jgi:hypothetical protein
MLIWTRWKLCRDEARTTVYNFATKYTMNESSTLREYMALHASLLLHMYGGDTPVFLMYARIYVEGGSSSMSTFPENSVRVL